jgi:spore germination cell wall hydrolase CwlJ-like protein
MARVMYFESIRSSDEGMLAVGTVVMNRVESDKYPNTVCGVVGQKNQFAPGVLSKPMQEGKSRERAYRTADQVLAGKRHRGVGNAMFFHTAGRTYRFTNMHYVAVAGGNAFYERKPTGRSYIPRSVIAQAGPRDSIAAPGGWFGRAFAADNPQPGRVAPPPAPVYVAAAPPPTATAAYADTPPPPPPTSIEALILASNGF